VAAAAVDAVPPRSSVLSSLGKWDGAWYQQVVQHGYPHAITVTSGGSSQSGVAFFPLFPLVVRAFHTVLPIGWSFELVALITGAAAAVALWSLAGIVTDRRAADRATALFCFFPGSIVFGLFYSEGLMLSLSALCLWALLRRRWWVAGLAAGLATAARPNAVVLVLCCAWAAGQAVRQRREWRSLVSVIMAPAGIVAFFVFLWVRTGNPLAWFVVERRGWGEGFDLGLASVHRVHMTVDDFGHDLGALTVTLSIVFILLCAPYVLRARLPVELLIFTAGILALAVGSRALGPRPRFVLTAFPLFIVLGDRLPDSVYRVGLAVSAGLLPILLLFTLKTLAITP
jgi:hypothetical protein